MGKRSGGEDKKNSGDYGETIVSDFLNKIGWTNHYPTGFNIDCIKEEKHKKSLSMGTHGIDKFFIEESHLDSGRLVHSIISSKHENNTYNNSNFKDYFVDLSDTIECYSGSDEYENNRNGYNTYKPDQIVGILFWISDESDRNYPLITQLNYKLPLELNYNRIQIMDNDRLEFITKSIEVVERNFLNYKREFYYISTPNNFSHDRKFSGKSLPVEMLNSDVQIFKLSKNDEIILVFVTKDIFHADELKRLLFLAHTTSNNLTNNVVIFFPSFEHELQKNILEVNRVKLLFRDKDFINTTTVKGYDIGFKDINKKIETTNEITSNLIDEPKSDNGKILPSGEYLRSFINNSSISESELNIFLKRKGIYFCNPKKEDMIPFICSLVISPKEFEILKDYHQLTEGKDKNRSSRLDTVFEVKGEDLGKVLKSIDLNKVVKSDFPMYQFTIPIASFNLDEKNKQLILEYEIESYYRNRTWDEQISNFKGKVAFDYSKKSLEIISNNIYTSKETYEINRQIINFAKQELKRANLIKSTTEKRILMDGLSNSQILQFLLSFTNNEFFADIEFINIISIDMELPEEIPENSDIKWMEKHVRKLKLDGAKIEELTLIKQDENHEYLKCWGITVEYKVDNFKIKGSATVKLEFSKMKNNSEFMILIDKCKFDSKQFSERSLREIIQKDIDSIKHDNYKKIKGEK